MTREIAHNFAAAGRMTDVDRIFQTEVRCHRGEIVGVMIHVVPIGDLTRSSVAAAVMRYDAIALVEKEQHLRIPVIGRQAANHG